MGVNTDPRSALRVALPALPALGAGLGRLLWNEVRGTIENEFEECELEVTVCTPREANMGYNRKRGVSG